MKKLICAMLALLTIAAVCSSCALGPNTIDIRYEDVEGGRAVVRYDDKTTITELTLDDDVVEIRDFSLCNAESLTRITLGKGVKTIGTWAMTNNQHLKEFVVDPANPYFTAVDGVLFSKDMKVLYYYPAGRNIKYDRFGQALNETTYDIPDGVEEIRDKAFYKCYYVNVTTFPDSIKRIGEKAFHRCSALKDFKVPASLEFIGKDAFAYDENLKKLEIGPKIKEIRDYAFFQCTGMESITIDAKESDLTLGAKWQPTAKGKIRDDCTITFRQ